MVGRLGWLAAYGRSGRKEWLALPGSKVWWAGWGGRQPEPGWFEDNGSFGVKNVCIGVLLLF